jgi:hypothetical protein
LLLFNGTHGIWPKIHFCELLLQNENIHNFEKEEKENVEFALIDTNLRFNLLTPGKINI